MAYESEPQPSPTPGPLIGPDYKEMWKALTHDIVDLQNRDTQCLSPPVLLLLMDAIYRLSLQDAHLKRLETK